MAEFVGGEPISVGVDEPITFKNKIDTAFDVGCGIVFRKSGLYRVSIDGRHMSVAVEPEQRWISVHEKLPIIENNIGARVLVTTSWGLVREAYYRVDRWEINDMPYKLSSVIAWMPLPEPYREDGKLYESN